MKVKKSQLEVFFKTLRGTEGVLGLTQARTRDAFMRPLGVQVDAMMADRAKIYEAYCVKDEDGNPDVKDGQFHFTNEKLEEAQKELSVFGNEEVEVEFVWGVSPTSLNEIMEKSLYKPLYGESDVIDEIIKAIFK